MSVEKYAFVSVADKTGLEPFAEALDDAEYNIVSLGGTAKIIEDLHIPVISTAEFTGVSLDLDRTASDREQREIIGAHLAQHMSLTRKELDMTNRNPIDLVYINLMRPEPVFDEEGRLGVKTDKGGIMMIGAAREGSRTVLTMPRQLDFFVNFLAITQSHSRVGSLQHEQLTEEVSDYLLSYERYARKLGKVATDTTLFGSRS